MNMPHGPVYFGETPRKHADQTVEGKFVTLLGEPYYQIRNFDAMEPFFVSVVSSADHWLFVASTGGISAGRVNAEQAIFPYYTVDKLTENFENTGPKAVLLVWQADRWNVWEPFSERYRGSYAVERNLYKNTSGTALVFEEINFDLGLTYRYAWRTSDRFGLVKTTWLINNTDSACQVKLVDGVQNILPANITTQTQNTFSVLLDAYKRSELDPNTGLAIFTLNSTLTDLAEPSESLLATTVAQVGLDAPGYLLSSVQLDAFRAGESISPETEVRGRRCAYFVHVEISLAANEERSWHLVADTGQDAAAVVQTRRWLQSSPAQQIEMLEHDIAAGQKRLWEIVASADGIQASESAMIDTHHFSNVMFNVMRGGVFADQYWIDKKHLLSYLETRSRPVVEANAALLEALPERIHLSELLTRAEAGGTAGLLRLSYGFLPLIFSRRHGDPSRPWNQFSIHIKQPDGSLNLGYEGNWRDIFQNWEALAYAYPEYIESMISTFLNATTVDGYNPYRITNRGIDWEIPEPGNPWANIGYWSDHQIIYLQKLMEISAAMHPGKLLEFLNQPLFSHANVPYRLKPYSDLLQDPYNTIDFDWDLERSIEARAKEMGTDAKLVLDENGEVVQATLAEKLLTLLMAKLVNFVPEGGIWMNTQRPEWNDANNALVGKGLSVVTLCYLRRYLQFCHDLFGQQPGEVHMNASAGNLFRQLADILNRHKPNLQGQFTDTLRRQVMDELGQAGSDYRWNFYQHGLPADNAALPAAEIAGFLALALEYVDHTLHANRRSDRLYHSYNILHISSDGAAITNLDEMLEGQVAVLSSGLLDAGETLDLLESLRSSALYQPSQNSYILYPDRPIQPFLEKNRLSPDDVQAVGLLQALIAANDRSLITVDAEGDYHFNGKFRNIKDVNRALAALKDNARFSQLVQPDEEKVRALFEKTFRHSEFTGRSGTFFAYEGLGSVYWHMVAKLLLAAQESAFRFSGTQYAPALLARYRDIRQGLGFLKQPAEFGAFPADPYSHTPKDQGAKQPGMTGLVKEEILTRQGELGYTVAGGRLRFDMHLFDPAEFRTTPAQFTYLDVEGQQQTIELPTGCLAYTICQTPVILQAGEAERITIHTRLGEQSTAGHFLDIDNSRHIFQRDGHVRRLTVVFQPNTA